MTVTADGKKKNKKVLEKVVFSAITIKAVVDSLRGSVLASWTSRCGDFGPVRGFRSVRHSGIKPFGTSFLKALRSSRHACLA
jgi:hypothetical protein